MAPMVKDSFMDLERHRQLLEDNIQTLRKTLRHWQTWEAEYEGLKEEILSASPDLTRDGLVFVMRQYKGDLVKGKEVEEIISSTTSKSTQQVLNLLDRRIDYVQQNVQSAEKQLEIAEHKLAVATVISTPEVRNEEGLPMTEIIEELDDEGNIISSRTSIPGSSKQQLLEVLQKAGVEPLPIPANITRSKVNPDENKEPARSPPTAVKPIAKTVQFADGTKPGPEVQKSHTAKRIEDIMSIANSQSAILSQPPVIPTDESAEDAALRREMLQYGMSEVGAVVAELDLEDGSDWSDEDFDPEDTSSIDDEDSFGRSTGKVVDDGLRQRMMELEERLGIRMMENIGKRPNDPNTVEEGIGQITISADEKKVEAKGVNAITQPTDDKTSHTVVKSNLQALNDTAPATKSVRFAERLDISSSLPDMTLQQSHVPTAQRSVAPVGDIVERKAPEQPISNPTARKSPSRFKSTRASMGKVLNGPLAASSMSQPGTSLSLHPAKSTTPKPFSTSIQFSPMVNPSREVPTGPEGKTLSSSVVERDISFTTSATEPDDLDPQLLHQEVATEYHKMRNRMVQRQGGFLKEEESEIVPLTEEEGGPKKLSRFKAARLART